MGGNVGLALAGASLAGSAATSVPQGAVQVTGDHQQRIAELEREKKREAEVREEKLAQASAAQRAMFAASGISPTDGSSEAVLQGLQDKTTRELEDINADFDAELQAERDSFADIQAEQLQKSEASTDLLSGDGGYLNLIKNWS